MKIADATAVVTGAASGIGEAVAKELSTRQVKHLVLVDRSATVEDVANEINKTRGVSVAAAFVGDTTSEKFRHEVFDQAARDMGEITICVPAAGITRDRLAAKIDKETGKVAIYSIDDFRLTLEVNLIAPVYWSLEMVARIAERRYRTGVKQWSPTENIQGVSILIGSVSSQGNAGQISYSAAKAGLQGAAATLMKEAMFHGVRCAIIHPGFTDTPMVHKIGEDYINKYILPATQLRRLIRPDEIASAVMFMIENNAVSGELWADAGWHPSV